MPTLAVVDQRVAMALEGRERSRGTVVAIANGVATVRLAGELLPATSGGWPVRAGDVVELERPRGLGGALRVVAIVQRSLPDVPTPVDGQQGHVLLVGSDLSLSWGTAGGGSHPDLATHDALGLATDAELTAAIAAHAALSDPHTGYVLESLLAAQGDLPYATGASAWARLAKGTAAQLLRMNAGATAPEWASLSATMESSATATTTMTTANTVYASGASLTLTEGVWDVHGDIEIASGANATAFKASGLLYDGSAYIDERAGNSPSVTGAQGSISIHVKRFVTVTAGNTKTVTLRAVSTVNGTVIRNNALNNTQVNNRATSLSAVRIG